MSPNNKNLVLEYILSRNVSNVLAFYDKHKFKRLNMASMMQKKENNYCTSSDMIFQMILMPKVISANFFLQNSLEPFLFQVCSNTIEPRNRPHTTAKIPGKTNSVSRLFHGCFMAVSRIKQIDFVLQN